MNDERPHRSIESFRKEAKRWLHALRDGNAAARARLDSTWPSAPLAPTLRDVQHAIALEQGHSGWIALTEYVDERAKSGTPFVNEYEIMAEILLEAYRTGTHEAMQRLYRVTWHRREWQGMRTYVQIGLGIPAGPDVEITMDDARYLVAREHGFETWDALLVDIANTTGEDAMIKGMSVFAAAEPNAESSRTSSRYWSAIVDALSSGAATGIEAHGGMTDELLEQVAAFPDLVTLRCSGSAGVTDEGLRHLARLPNLRHLDLSGTAITDRGLAVLRELRQLEHISLSWTNISDAGVENLASIATLQHVNISGTHCGDASIRSLANKEKLSHFYSGESTTDAGLAALHDFPVFKLWQGVKRRDFLLDYDSSPNQLFLRGALTERGFAHLVGLNGLFGLNVDDAKMALPGAVLTPLVTLPHLGWLAFDAGDDAMPYIARLPNLLSLFCQDSPASDAGWVALAESKSIERIWGRRCHGLGNNGFRALSRMPSLRSWAGSCKNVDDSALAALPEFPRLDELMPMDVPDASYRHIAKCANIETLTLMYCRDTTDAATEHVACMQSLRRYFASYTQITDRTPLLLSTVDTLENITFDSCARLTNAGIAALARLPKLRELGISGRGLTSAVRDAFPERVTVRYSV